MCMKFSEKYTYIIRFYFLIFTSCFYNVGIRYVTRYSPRMHIKELKVLKVFYDNADTLLTYRIYYIIQGKRVSRG